jgi:hypothetical protein
MGVERLPPFTQDASRFPFAGDRAEFLAISVAEHEPWTRTARIAPVGFLQPELPINRGL